MEDMERIAQMAQMACILEVCAPKPGNVNRLHDYTDTSFEDFLISAAAIVPAFETAAQWSVGQIIRQSVCDTRRVVQSNTNLGMILLLAPLVKAAVTGKPGNLRQDLSAILKSLTVDDARLAYDAIRLTRPGGLGTVHEADVAENPSITLRDAMALARERDSVAREYTTDFELSFEIGLPALNDALRQGLTFSNAVVHSFLKILSATPDTLVARKRGIESAREISRRASETLAKGGVFTAHGRAALAELDRDLRDPAHTLNPGATADLTAAAIFLALVSKTA
jgi:triphosphoribosyl-dephospho-CoA synthase